MFGNLHGRNGFHADYHVATQGPSRATLKACLVHRDVLALFGTLQWNSRIRQGAIIGETAPNQKRNRVLRPIVGCIRYFHVEFTVAINGIPAMQQQFEINA